MVCAQLILGPRLCWSCAAVKVESVCACKHCLQLKPKDVMSAKDKKKNGTSFALVLLYILHTKMSV